MLDIILNKPNSQLQYCIVFADNAYHAAKLTNVHKDHILVEINYIAKKIKHRQFIYSTDATYTCNNDIDTTILYDLLVSDSLATTKLNILQLAAIYFGNNYTYSDITSLLLALHNDKFYFIDYHDGHFLATTEEMQQKQLLKQRQLEQFKNDTNMYYKQLQAILNNPGVYELNIPWHKPNAKSPIYVALQQLCGEMRLTPTELCYKYKLIQPFDKYLIDQFICSNFTQNIWYVNNNLPIQYDISDFINNNQLKQVFAIDSADTIEVDDAFSLQTMQNEYLIGIHIAAPATINNIANNLLEHVSTIYCPNHKITMLSQDIINQYSLIAPHNYPVISIYFKVDKEFNILNYESKLETITINANLSIEYLEAVFATNDTNCLYKEQLDILLSFAQNLANKRKSNTVHKADYSIIIDDDEKISIKQRTRGGPVDTIVSELMILANCTWGRMLTNHFIPALYRVKLHHSPVKTQIQPDSHVGLNVDYYVWATSPLRRATDFINQQQIIKMLRNQNHVNPTIDLLSMVFDARYAKCINFQKRIETYYVIKFLLQEKITQLSGRVINKNKLQIHNLPLTLTSDFSQSMIGTDQTIIIYNINPANIDFDWQLT